MMILRCTETELWVGLWLCGAVLTGNLLNVFGSKWVMSTKTEVGMFSFHLPVHDDSEI